MVAFIDDYRGVYGVEPICRVLPIAPSTYFAHKARQADPRRIPERLVRDAVLREEIERVWTENRSVYGARKAWLQRKREGFEVARCTIERLMAQMGLRGAVRGGASSAPRSPTRAHSVRRISFRGTSRPIVPTASGSPALQDAEVPGTPGPGWPQRAAQRTGGCRGSAVGGRRTSLPVEPAAANHRGRLGQGGSSD